MWAMAVFFSVAALLVEMITLWRTPRRAVPSFSSLSV